MPTKNCANTFYGSEHRFRAGQYQRKNFTGPQPDSAAHPKIKSDCVTFAITNYRPTDDMFAAGVMLPWSATKTQEMSMKKRWTAEKLEELLVLLELCTVAQVADYYKVTRCRIYQVRAKALERNSGN